MLLFVEFIMTCDFYFQERLHFRMGFLVFRKNSLEIREISGRLFLSLSLQSANTASFFAMCHMALHDTSN